MESAVYLEPRFLRRQSVTDHYQFCFDNRSTWTHNYPTPEAAAAEAERMRKARKAKTVKVTRFEHQFDAEEAYANEADFGGW